jgi:hypothetical protein
VPLEELAPYLGAYQETDGKTLQVVVQNQHLALDYPGQTVYELRPPEREGDAAGRWAFRMTPDLALEFHLGEDGKAASLTFHERGTQRVCPRVDLPGMDTPPTLEEVLALRRAREFETRLAELGGCRMRGTVRFVHAGADGTATLLFRAPDRQRDEIDLSPFGSHTTAVAGDRAAMRSSFQPFEELTGAFLDEQRLAHPMALFGDWRAHFDSVRVIRNALELGRRQHVVELEKQGLDPQFAYVDFETGDLVKLEGRVLARGMPSLPRTTRFEDWRDVGGLRLPFRMITEDEASGRIVIQIESFESGLELPDGVFVLQPE